MADREQRSSYSLCKDTLDGQDLPVATGISSTGNLHEQ